MIVVLTTATEIVFRLAMILMTKIGKIIRIGL